MAFSAAGFKRVLNGPGTQGVFHYKSNDLYSAIDDADYFLSVYDQLDPGDLIFCSCDLDGTILPGILIVTAATSSTVTTTAFPIA